MRFIDIIGKKRDGGVLTSEEIDFFIDCVKNKSVPDYQISALLMAIFLRGMSFEETSTLTAAMVNSGTRCDLSFLPVPTCDKHSTGGVGDKISIPLAPIVASCGVAVGMMSGRGLGHTGGTLDKLESIPGFDVNLSLDDYYSQLKRIGVALIGQTGTIAVADKYLYALRDATSTVESIPLITASIMSKKIAEGTKNLVIDLKVGSGAFMKTIESAETLARYLIETGRNNGVTTEVVITDMNSPLGKAVGNANEIIESVEILKGNLSDGPVYELTVELSSRMIALASGKNSESAKKDVLESIKSGRALKLLETIISSQKGNPDVLTDYNLLPKPSISREITLDTLGIQPDRGTKKVFLEKLDAYLIGTASNILGAGRLKKEDAVDHAAGIIMQAAIGDEISTDQPIMILQTNSAPLIDQAIPFLKEAIKATPGPVARKPLIIKVVQ